LTTRSRLALFEEVVLPHLNAAHNLARWLLRNPEDARDAVQESCLRAFRFFDDWRGGDAKAWLLAIVRNTCRTWKSSGAREAALPFDETTHTQPPAQEQTAADGERLAILRNCIEHLPLDFREVLVMREIEEMSYAEIAAASGLAIGTVMSRLSRARKRLEECAGRRTMEAIR
jgi:RNA polymerase sigma factor (sigma-70 family)